MKKVTLRLPDTLLGEIRELARLANRSINGEIRTVLEQFVWEQKKKKRKKENV